MFEIKCRFCDIKTGEIALPYALKDTKVTNEILGIEDSRCDSCENEYGNFKQMAEEFERKNLGTYADFMVQIKKANFKKKDFDTLISNLEK